MKYIPSTDDQWMKLVTTSRKSFGRASTRGANYHAKERGLVVKKNRISDAIREAVTADYENTRLVYVCHAK